MFQPDMSVATPETGGGGTSASGPQTESGGNAGGPSSPGEGTSEPVYDDEEVKPKTLAENYQFYLSTLSTGRTGGSFTMNGSLQPEAPQEPGNVLTGRFVNAMNGKAKWLLVAVVVIALVWWFNRKKG